MNQMDSSQGRQLITELTYHSIKDLAANELVLLDEMMPGKDGLTTLEEKSLGAIAKGGSRPVVEVIEYSEQASKNGLVIMNTPSAACESMTGLLGGGSQMIIFSTGRGNAIGAPIAPTVKITGNPHTAAAMKENIDVDVSAIISNSEPLELAADRLWNEMVKTAQGKLTRCEVLQEDQLSVSRFGPSV